MSKSGIIIACTIRGGQHQQDHIISSEGVCRCLTCGSHLNAEWMTLMMEIKYEREDKSNANR